jgi:oligogalacturonide lyase
MAGREAGMVGAAMGTTTVSHDDRYWAVPAKIGAKFQFIVIDTASGAHATILEADSVGHPEFHPSDNRQLRYAGKYHSRIWVIQRDGSGNRLVYNRQGTEWIVHETWNPARSREIITVNWPRGCIGIDIDTGAMRNVCSFNAWHPSINRQGTLMCADTVYPDIGLQLFDPVDGVGQPTPLCFPEATSEGKHWNTDHCPYDDEDYKQGKWKVYAPQHTHPHPAFSPDGRFVIFTSDRTGHSQVYEVAID